MTRIRRGVVIAAVVITAVAAAYSEYILHSSAVYIHLLYVPLILSGLWHIGGIMPLTACYAFGHVTMNYFRTDSMSVEVILRSLLIIAAGSTIQFLSSQLQSKKALLIQEKSKYHSTIMSICDGVIVTDPSGLVQSMNPAAEGLLGCTLEEVEAKSIEEVFFISDYLTGRVPVNPVLEAIEKRSVCHLSPSAILDTMDGHFLHIENSASPILDDDGHLIGAVTVFRDISESIRSDKKQSENQMLLKTIFNKAPQGIVVFNSMTGKILRANEAYEKMVGLSGTMLRKSDWMCLTHPDDVAVEKKHISDVVERGMLSSKFVKRLIQPSGEEVWVEVTILRFDHEIRNQPHHLAIVEDLTEMRGQSEEIQFLKHHDPLTGLLNRTSFERYCDQSDGRNHPMAVVVVDIDHLKGINQEFGHALGDRVLKAVANKMKEMAGEQGEAFRTGSDEFCLVLPGADDAEAESVEHRIASLVEDCCREEKPEGFEGFGVSTGSAASDLLEDTTSLLFDQAESRMYLRKLTIKSSRHSSLVSSIRTALIEKSHETEAHAQRLVSMALAIGARLGLNDQHMSELKLCAALHDIGKVCVDEVILNKKGSLDDKEWQIIKRHPEIGYRIAKASPELECVAEGILSHHEKYDGSGYPNRLKGEQIPLIARIVAVVDSYDAMTQERPYGRIRTKEEAVKEIRRCSGTQFDPIIVDAAVEVIEGLEFDIVCNTTDQAAV